MISCIRKNAKKNKCKHSTRIITPIRSHPTGQSNTEIVKSSEYRHSSKKLVIIVPLLSIVLWKKKKKYLIFLKDKTVDSCRDDYTVFQISHCK